MEPIVIVTWRDAHFHLDDTDPEVDYLCRTVGWLRNEDATWLELSSERAPDGHRATTFIPTSCVLDMVTLEPAPEIRGARNTSGLETFAAPV